jgi:hypothetical protein
MLQNLQLLTYADVYAEMLWEKNTVSWLKNSAE